MNSNSWKLNFKKFHWKIKLWPLRIHHLGLQISVPNFMAIFPVVIEISPQKQVWEWAGSTDGRISDGAQSGFFKIFRASPYLPLQFRSSTTHTVSLHSKHSDPECICVWFMDYFLSKKKKNQLPWAAANRVYKALSKGNREVIIWRKTRPICGAHVYFVN